MSDIAAELRDLLHPRAVAVFGASDNVAKFGGRVMHYLTKHRFPGRIVPINPSRHEVLGIHCYPSIGAAGPVDVALLAVRRDVLLPALRECGEAGVRYAVVMTTGFAEAGPEGARMEVEMVRDARAAGMRIIGPNCMGLINPWHPLALTSSLVLEPDQMPRGHVGLVSQSGALMVSMFDRAQDAGIGFSVCASLGNQCDLEVCDLIEYMLHDPNTRVITAYVEGFKQPRRFAGLAAAARAARKPLLLVKAGRSEAGVRAARSHTASLAGDYAALQAVCRRYGVQVAGEPHILASAGDLFARFGIPAGDGIAVLSPSGGGAAVAVDRISEVGMRLARLSAATKQELGHILVPPQADNPVDMGGRMLPDAHAVARRSLAALATDPDVAVVLIVLTTTPDYERAAAALADTAVSLGTPVAFAITPGSVADKARAVIADRKLPRFEGVNDALEAIRLWLGYGRHLRQTPEADAGHTAHSAARMPRYALPAIPDGQMTGPEVSAMLAAYGIPIARESVARSVEEAVRQASAIDYPVALKAISRDVIHKSDIGALQLNLGDAGSVRAGWASIERAVQAVAPSRFEGCVVQQMVRGARAELIVGVKRDPQFGPMVLVGLGGIFVEIMKDVALSPAPLDIAQAAALLRQLKAWPLLAGARSRPPLDADAAAQVVSQVSRLAIDLEDRLSELDVNPLLVMPRGGGAVAVDARATLTSSAAGPSA